METRAPTVSHLRMPRWTPRAACITRPTSSRAGERSVLDTAATARCTRNGRRMAASMSASSRGRRRRERSRPAPPSVRPSASGRAWGPECRDGWCQRPSGARLHAGREMCARRPRSRGGTEWITPEAITRGYQPTASGRAQRRRGPLCRTWPPRRPLTRRAGQWRHPMPALGCSRGRCRSQHCAPHRRC